MDTRNGWTCARIIALTLAALLCGCGPASAPSVQGARVYLSNGQPVDVLFVPRTVQQ